jgi:predicted O-methyltransferase YrrM
MPAPLPYTTINHYIANLVPTRPAEVEKMEAHAQDIHFPIIGPAVGQFCYLIARAISARRIFELGSGFGYSTSWFARAVKENGGGEVYHVVWDESLSKEAREHLDRLGYGEIVHYQVSEAIDALTHAQGPFDLIFNDIVKECYPESLPIIHDKLRPGGILLVDNIFWSGRIYDARDTSPQTAGVREFTRLITADPAWIASFVPIRDGLLIAYKKE